VTLLRRHNHVVAVDRRALSASEMADHQNVEWYQVDLCDRAVEGTMACIAAGGGAQVLPVNRAEASHEPRSAERRARSRLRRALRSAESAHAPLSPASA